MQTFKDKNGTVWTIAFTPFLRRKILAETGVDVAKILIETELKKLEADEALFFDLIWLSIEKQASQSDIDFQSFFEDRVDSEVFEDACNKIFEAHIDFLPAKKKAAGRKILDELNRIGKKSAEMQLTAIASADLSTAGDEVLKVIEEQLAENLPAKK